MKIVKFTIPKLSKIIKSVDFIKSTGYKISDAEKAFFWGGGNSLNLMLNKRIGIK
jgi:hypothetical protein